MTGLRAAGGTAVAPVGLQRIAVVRPSAGPDSARRWLSSAGRQRSSRSTAMTRSAPSRSSARVRPPGPGPTSTTVRPAQRTGRPGDAPRQVEIEDEVLAEALLGAEAEGADDLAQRRQPVGACAVRSARLMRAGAS